MESRVRVKDKGSVNVERENNSIRGYDSLGLNRKRKKL